MFENDDDKVHFRNDTTSPNTTCHSFSIITTGPLWKDRSTAQPLDTGLPLHHHTQFSFFIQKIIVLLLLAQSSWEILPVRTVSVAVLVLVQLYVDHLGAALRPPAFHVLVLSTPILPHHLPPYPSPRPTVWFSPGLTSYLKLSLFNKVLDWTIYVVIACRNTVL